MLAKPQRLDVNLHVRWEFKEPGTGEDIDLTAKGFGASLPERGKAARVRLVPSLSRRVADPVSLTSAGRSSLALTLDSLLASFGEGKVARGSGVRSC